MADNTPISLRDNPGTAPTPPPGPNPIVLVIATAVISLIAGVLITTVITGTSSDNDTANAISDAAIEGTVEARVALALEALTPTAMPTPTDPPDDDAFLGPANAPVVIVEFSDFQCGYCGQWYQTTLPQILEKYPDEVKFVYRDYPIFGEASLRAAMATECAEEQGGFWEMHNIIFEQLLAGDSRPSFDQATLVGLASDVGLDTGDFSECLTSQRYLNEIRQDYQDATAYGFRGTPGFVINGTAFSFGAQSFEVFDEIIQRHLAGS